MSVVFFFNDTATTEIYTLSLHDALPIFKKNIEKLNKYIVNFFDVEKANNGFVIYNNNQVTNFRDRKSTRLNSSHANISYAVFCLKKKRTGRCPRATSQRISPPPGRIYPN